MRKIKNLFSLKISGFSLLEMAFVLMIMGCVLVVALPFFSSQLHLEQEKKTTATFESIANHLATHLIQHKRLPCPAAPDAKDEDIGREDLKYCDKAGLIPYKTLGMSPALTRDGFNHAITFVTHPAFSEKPREWREDDSLSVKKDLFTGDTSSPQSYCSVKAKAGFKILDESKNLINEDADNEPIFVLISHGKNGGDFLSSGKRRPLAVKDDFKVENSNDDITFIDAPQTKHCDDRLFWIDRYAFAAIYAGEKCR